ncbi:MAG: DUF1848 domain-containing protein [Rhodospirillales bacterium]|nr:DUF1848 domain-containing protein [Rhodospirillales bacterium]
MIISASYRTDIPAFYGDWFGRRLAAGRVRVANPYGGPPSEVALSPEAVDGFVFWTRNVGPFLPRLDQVRGLGIPFMVQFTITGYPRALDRATIDSPATISQVLTLAARFGRRTAVWRYDPIVVTTATPVDWHIQNFAGLAKALAGAVDEVVVSFVHDYRKTRRNLAEAAARHGFVRQDPDDTEKATILDRFAAIAAEHGMAFSLCGQRPYLRPGVGDARCIDAGRLSDVAGRLITAAAKPHRDGCACVQSRDIGAYDSCAHGCVYCYAVANHDTAKRRLAAHDPNGEFLIPPSSPKSERRIGAP